MSRRQVQTLHPDYRECILDIDIFGRVVSTPQQSLEEMKQALFEEFKLMKPMPTLESKRYELSRLVSPNYQIDYEGEVELQDGESLVDLLNGEVSLPKIDFDDLSGLVPDVQESFRYEEGITDDIRLSIIEKYDMKTGEEFKPGIRQTENIVGSVSEATETYLSDEEIERLGEEEEEEELAESADEPEVAEDTPAWLASARVWGSSPPAEVPMPEIDIDYGVTEEGEVAKPVLDTGQVGVAQEDTPEEQEDLGDGVYFGDVDDEDSVDGSDGSDDGVFFGDISEGDEVARDYSGDEEYLGGRSENPEVAGGVYDGGVGGVEPSEEDDDGVYFGDADEEDADDGVYFGDAEEEDEEGSEEATDEDGGGIDEDPDDSAYFGDADEEDSDDGVYFGDADEDGLEGSDDLDGEEPEADEDPDDSVYFGDEAAEEEAEDPDDGVYFGDEEPEEEDSDGAYFGDEESEDSDDGVYFGDEEPAGEEEADDGGVYFGDEEPDEDGEGVAEEPQEGDDDGVYFGDGDDFAPAPPPVTPPPAPKPVAAPPQPPAQEAVDRSSEPTEIRAFLRKHPRSDIKFVLQYFTKKQIEDAIKMGRINRKGNILRC